MCPLDLNLVRREPRAEPQCERGSLHNSHRQYNEE